MGDDENWRSELDISGLSLIDEDDSLLDPSSYEFSDRGLCLFGDTHICDEEIRVSTLEGNEDILQPHEPQNMTKSAKYNLRKSLAWDKAFFTSAGVLEPHELSSMIQSNHMGERKNLPTIQEDVNRSTESISTLQSVETSQEFAMSSDAVTPGKSKELGPSPTPSRLDNRDSQAKMKPNDSLKSPSIRAQGLGKVTKQPVAAKEHNTSISRPPSGLGRTKRALVDVNKAKQEKNFILTRGKEPLAPISTSTRSIVSKPVSALRSSLVSKNELTSSCSSLESCASVSSSASNKSSVKQKKDESLRIASHSLANGSTSRGASRNRVQPKVPPVSASRTYKCKLSSNVSCASSSVDWSLQASTPNEMGKGKQKTVLGKRGPAIDDTKQTLKPLSNSKDVCVVQDNTKPDKRGSALTGLRVPSLKIGYFDGESSQARSSVAATPRGSCTGPVSGLAKHGARSPNEATASRSKSGKSQPTRSPLIVESTNCKPKVSPVTRSPRLMVSPKLTNKMYSKVSAEEQLKGNGGRII